MLQISGSLLDLLLFSSEHQGENNTRADVRSSKGVLRGALGQGKEMLRVIHICVSYTIVVVVIVPDVVEAASATTTGLAVVITNATTRVSESTLSTSQPMHKRANHPANKSTSQAMWTLHVPVNQPPPQPANQLTTQPISQSARQAINLSLSQPVHQSSSQPINQSTCQPVTQSTRQPVDQSTLQPTSLSANKPINQPTSQPIDQSTVNQSTRHAVSQ